MIPKPFFPNPLEDFEPKKPDFEPESDPDYDSMSCVVCSKQFGVHSVKQVVECALKEVRGDRYKT